MLYRVIKPIGTPDGPKIKGEIVSDMCSTGQTFYKDALFDRAQDLIDKGIIEAIDEETPAAIEEPESVKVQKAKFAATEAKAAQELAEADARSAQARLAKALTLLTPEQLAQIEGAST